MPKITIYLGKPISRQFFLVKQVLQEVPPELYESPILTMLRVLGRSEKAEQSQKTNNI